MTKISMEMNRDRNRLEFSDTVGTRYDWYIGNKENVSVGDNSIGFEVYPSQGELGTSLNIEIKQVLDNEFDILISTDKNTPMADPIEVLNPIILHSQNGELIFPYHGEGLIIKASPPEWTDFILDLYKLDMPLCIMADGKAACMLWYEIPSCDDGEFMIRTVESDGASTLGMVPRLLPCKSEFGYNRTLRITFTSDGGYVALLKRYRGYLKEKGYLVTLREKMENVPAVNNLAGAVDLWFNWFQKKDAYGDCIRKCHEEGIVSAIVNMPVDKQMAEEAKTFGYLVSRYECPHYLIGGNTDDKALEANNEIYKDYGSFNNIFDSYGDMEQNKKGFPEEAVIGSDGEKVVIWDQHGIIAYDRCSSEYPDYFRRTLPNIIEEHGLNTVFIDITGNVSLKECFHNVHPQTRTEDRLFREGCFKVCSENGLVVGTEHGKWWTTKFVSYHEGMMSLEFQCPWQGGHFQRPEPDTDLTPYIAYGLSPIKRLPLFELVFHDCVVNYWYWGDSTDWLHKIRPELTDIKDLMNILTGTLPLVWLGKISGFDLPENNWDRFFQTTSSILPLHERIFCDEMISHEWMTKDRLVQRTKFASGIDVYVNFGDEDYKIDTHNGSIEIGHNGYAAIGDTFLHSNGLFTEL